MAVRRQEYGPHGDRAREMRRRQRRTGAAITMAPRASFDNLYPDPARGTLT